MSKKKAADKQSNKSVSRSIPTQKTGIHQSQTGRSQPLQEGQRVPPPPPHVNRVLQEQKGIPVPLPKPELLHPPTSTPQTQQPNDRGATGGGQSTHAPATSTTTTSKKRGNKD